MKPTTVLLAFASLSLAAFAQAPQPRMLCFFLDLNSLNSSDLAAAQDQAVKFIQSQTSPADRIAVMTYASRLNVVQDFTADHEKLVAALRSIMADQSSGADAAARLQGIQAAAVALGNLPDKKMMLYYSTGVPSGGQADLRPAIDALTRANISVWPVDVRNPR